MPLPPKRSGAAPSRPWRVRKILDVATAEWGVVVTLVELKDIQLPESMKRAMARQAEAEREKRAKIIAAEGGALAADALGTAAAAEADPSCCWAPSRSKSPPCHRPGDARSPSTGAAPSGRGRL
ncbi:SPFH domain-containing protein [Plantactinospora alkalitolerans]|uniref:SPFH domain-containing protein n=1 Tax=Plantactinospora alkalitolerans TaxID=2789879 RepID=UPI001E4B8E6B|nr:SPFH domain-containing protein [Plantactinospora alkalitolerans]